MDNVANDTQPSFYQTFYKVTNLISIPSTLFAGITSRGSIATNTMVGTFSGTKLVTTCLLGTMQYTTGWEDSSKLERQLLNSFDKLVPVGQP